MHKAAALEVIQNMLRDRRNELSQCELFVLKLHLARRDDQERIENLKKIVALLKSIADLEAVEQLILDSPVSERNKSQFEKVKL